MEIQKFVILKKYLEDIEDKTHFTPQEIVFKVCDIIEEENQKAQEEKQELIDTLLELNEKCLSILNGDPVREFDHLQSRIETLTKKQK